MKNLNSSTSELFPGKEKRVYDYMVHYRMPKIRYNNKRRRVAYQGIVNQDPAKLNAIQLNLLK